MQFTTFSRLTANACYQAMKAHDTRFDGRFFVGVSSTHIYCRPICRVRMPLQKNCGFYPSAAAAEAAGFVDVPQLLAPSPNNTNTTTGTKIDGNAAGNFATVSYALPVSIAPGQEFFLRFLDKDDRGSDNAIAVDNLTVAASYSTPTQNRLPKGYALTIAPNPTAHTAQAQMQLPQAENIMVEVYNTLGQKVASSTRSSYAEGANTIAIPTENLINGNYYVRILGDNFAVTQSLAKM